MTEVEMHYRIMELEQQLGRAEADLRMKSDRLNYIHTHPFGLQRLFEEARFDRDLARQQRDEAQKVIQTIDDRSRSGESEYTLFYEIGELVDAYLGN